MPTPDYRAELATIMRSTLRDEQANGTWTYEATRPKRVPLRPWHPKQRVNGDCSKGVQFLCWWVYAPDPMGMDFGPYGNSQTLATRLQHLADPSELRVGDFVTFGKWGNEHAAMVLEAGADPLLWSFGHRGAPNTYRLSQDRRPAQYLRNPLPDYVPTPADKLRARTGWFAWVAWRRGEGDWQNYGAANKTVRPNVPKLIPASWWTRYVQFLAARKKGDAPTTAGGLLDTPERTT